MSCSRLFFTGCLALFAAGCASVDLDTLVFPPLTPEREAREADSLEQLRVSRHQFDVDGDGRFSREEWRQNGWAFFMVFDRDGDEALDIYEYLSARCRADKSDRLPDEFIRICVPSYGRDFIVSARSQDGRLYRHHIDRSSDRTFNNNDHDRDGFVPVNQ